MNNEQNKDLTNLLVDFIRVRRYANYDEVEKEAERLCKTWRSETWRRSLRRHKNIKAIGKDGGLPNGQNPIIGYKYIFEENTNYLTYKMDKKPLRLFQLSPIR